MSDTVRGQASGSRREMIVAAASELFSRKGYTSTGVDEIGLASGITGPGVYRHFDNKSEVLNAVVRRSLDRLLTGVAQVCETATDDWTLLEGLVHNMIRSVLDDRAGWVVITRDHRHLSPVAVETIARGYRDHMQLWSRSLAAARPDLDATEVRVIVRCVSAFTAPLATPPDLPRSRVEELLAGAALAALRGTVPLRSPV